jgi:hypothetical protein
VKRILFYVSAVSVAVAASFACSGPDKGELDRAASLRGQASVFRTAGVGTVFERRCGSLDCHGSISRNMRIYSSRGLRLPNEAGLLPGGGETTLDESTANYNSILLLEPERTNEVLRGELAPEVAMLVLKKPLGIESHKGGLSIRKGDDAERCIVTWLTASSTEVDANACARAAVFPKE